MVLSIILFCLLDVLCCVGDVYCYWCYCFEEIMFYLLVECYVYWMLVKLKVKGVGLFWFVEVEFEYYLCCGWFEYGFFRVKCEWCRFERLVAFSCKRRGFCLSCGVRRMAVTAAHLVDHMLPAVPVS